MSSSRAATRADARDFHRRAREMSREDAHAALLAMHDAHRARARGAALTRATVVETDADAMAREHRFVREDDDVDADGRGVEHGVKLAKRYYAKLFKTYAICDLSRAPKVGMRWRTEEEVRSGKGQFVCGELACDGVDALQSFECHFAYVETGAKKSALVKVRVCGTCAVKLGSSDGHTRVDDAFKGKTIKGGGVASANDSERGERRRRKDKKSKKRKRSDDDDERRLLKTLLA